MSMKIYDDDHFMKLEKTCVRNAIHITSHKNVSQIVLSKIRMLP